MGRFFNTFLTGFKLVIIFAVALSSYAEQTNQFQTHQPQTKNQTTILVLGDSLSAAFGINEEDGWVALLKNQLNKEKRPSQLINASISGETTSGGLARLPKLLSRYQPDIVIVELGANDGLRGYPVNRMQKNLQKIISLSQAQNAQVLLLGMQIPPNYGSRYTEAFRQTYVSVAKNKQISLIPFFLEGVALNMDLMQKDGIHPTAEAQPILLANVKPFLDAYLNEAPHKDNAVRKSTIN